MTLTRNILPQTRFNYRLDVTVCLVRHNVNGLIGLLAAGLFDGDTCIGSASFVYAPDKTGRCHVEAWRAVS